MNLSQTPCWKRIQRLGGRPGVIKGSGPRRSGKGGLEPDGLRPVEALWDYLEAWMQQFADFVRQIPEVMEIHLDGWRRGLHPAGRRS